MNYSQFLETTIFFSKILGIFQKKRLAVGDRVLKNTKIQNNKKLTGDKRCPHREGNKGPIY